MLTVPRPLEPRSSFHRRQSFRRQNVALQITQRRHRRSREKVHLKRRLRPKLFVTEAFLLRTGNFDFLLFILRKVTFSDCSLTLYNLN